MRSNIIKYIFFIFIAVLLIFSIYKVNSGNSNEKNGTIGANISQEQEMVKEIKIAIAELDNMNPILSKNKNVQEAGKLIFEPLVNLTQDFRMEPCLATEWAKSDGNTYIIKLRENVEWANGEKFNGEDVRFTIDKLKEISSIYSYNVQYVTRIDVIDNYTLKITLDRDIPFFEYNLTFPIMSKAYYEGEDFAQSNKNMKPMGTGMFKVVDASDSNILLEKNDKWWNQSNKNSTLEKITININSSMAEVYNAFKMGNVDFVNTSNLNYKDYIGTLGYSTKEYTAREHGFLAINTQNDLLSNVEVRQAILAGIDKNNVVATAFEGKWYATDFPLAYGSWLDDRENSGKTYNPEFVNKVLEDNGWTLRRGNWQKTINYRTQKLDFNLIVKASDESRVTVANVISAQLGNVGIAINVRALSDAAYNASLASKDYDILLGATEVSASPDLTTYFGSDNLANYENAEVSAILQEVNNTKDENVIKEKYKRLKEIYKTDVPYVSLYFSKNVAIYNTSLAGEVNPNWFNPFYSIENWYK